MTAAMATAPSPKKIVKADTRIQQTAYGVTALLMGLPFMAIGSFFALAGFGFIPLPGKANAPLWVIGFVGLSFATAGAMLDLAALRGIRAKRRHKQIAERHPAEPWYSDYPWDFRGIGDHRIAGALQGMFGVLFLGVFLVPFNWWAFLSREPRLGVQLITGFFDLILLIALGTVIYRLLQTLKFGKSRLSFATFPFYIGEDLDVGFSPNRFGELQVTLRFVEERFEAHGSGKNRTVSQVSYEYFAETKTIACGPALHEVPIRFQIPANPKWVTQLTANPAVHYWELVICAARPGIDFRTTFPLPIYETS